MSNSDFFQFIFFPILSIFATAYMWFYQDRKKFVMFLGYLHVGIIVFKGVIAIVVATLLSISPLIK